MIILELAGRAFSIVKYHISLEIATVSVSENQFVFNRSLACKVLTGLCQIIGGEYLKKRLFPIISDLVNRNVLLEIDIDRLLPEERGVRLGNILKLNLLVASILDTFVNTINLIPVFIKRICHFMVHEEPQLSNFPTVTQIIFFCFIIPAFENPEDFGLLPSPVSRNVRRSLNLVAEVLRNAVTGEKFFLEHSDPLNIYTEKEGPVMVQAVENWLKTKESVNATSDIATVATSMVEEAIDILSGFVSDFYSNINEQFSPYNIEQPVKFIFTDLIDVLYKYIPSSPAAAVEKTLTLETSKK